jgi:hypothetical protein
MDGKEIHVYGSGAPDYSQDTSANLMSYLIMQSYLWQDACVSPLENHPSSQVYEQYNFEAYLPNPPLGTAPVHWDSGLLFDPSDVGQPLHASYANVVLCDNRVRRSWTTYGVDPSVVMFGSRGPAVDQGVGYDRSPTLRFIEPKSGWNGNVVLADSSVLTMNSPFVTGTNDFFDFLFASDDSVADDQWLGVTVSSSADCQAVQTAFDPLRN